MPNPEGQLMKDTANIDETTEPTFGNSPVPEHPPRRGCGRLFLWIIAFIILENIIIPPRYQVSNNIALAAIWSYQSTVSPVFRETGIVRCRFYPSCSEYSRLSLLHYGFLSGFVRSSWRVMRCNPFNNGPHEDWPYEGAWENCRQLPPSYLNLPEDVHKPSISAEGR
jgi:hypothetical protein